MQNDIITIVKRFESGEVDFESTQKSLEKLTGKIIDRDHLKNYWRSESLEDFAEILATRPIDNYEKITSETATKLIEEALLEPGGAIFLRNAEALEKRYQKTEGFLTDLVFQEDIDDLTQILSRLKEDTASKL